MGTLIANAMECKVTVISSSNKKENLAKKLGAEEYMISSDSVSMKKREKSFDIILNTIGAEHDLMPYLGLLKKKGTMVMLGIVTTPLKVSIVPQMYFSNINQKGSCFPQPSLWDYFPRLTTYTVQREFLNNSTICIIKSSINVTETCNTAIERELREISEYVRF